MRIAGAGQLLFAATLIALGVWGLWHGAFTAIWAQVPKAMPGRMILAYLCALISLATGAGLLWGRTAVSAARLLLAWLLLWMLLLKGRVILLAPLVAVSWENWGETAVLVAAAWVIYAGLAGRWDSRRLAFAKGSKGLRIARVVYALAMIAFGAAHLAYIKETAALVPGWLPAPVAWAWFTGLAYIAAGAAILVRIQSRLAASLSVLQMGLFTLLVWAPRIASGSADAGQWDETVVSWALTVGGWVVADSYRGGRWLSWREALLRA